MTTQFLMMFGIDLPEGWTDSLDILLYTLVFMLINHVLVLNFGGCAHHVAACGWPRSALLLQRGSPM